MKQPPYKDPIEAINYLKEQEYVLLDPGEWRRLSWREIASRVSQHMEGETSKAVMWNVAHKKYKCPPDVAAALRKMSLLQSTKRWRFFYEVGGEEEYEKFKLEYLNGGTFTEWVERKRMHDDIAGDIE